MIAFLTPLLSFGGTANSALPPTHDHENESSFYYEELGIKPRTAHCLFYGACSEQELPLIEVIKVIETATLQTVDDPVNYPDGGKPKPKIREQKQEEMEMFFPPSKA